MSGIGGSIWDRRRLIQKIPASPFSIKLTGVLNPDDPKAGKFGRARNDGWQLWRALIILEVRAIEFPDDPEASPTQLLQSVEKVQSADDRSGDKHMLTKARTIVPEFPLSVVGLFRRRYRTFQVTDVEVFRLKSIP